MTNPVECIFRQLVPPQEANSLSEKHHIDHWNNNSFTVLSVNSVDDEDLSINQTGPIGYGHRTESFNTPVYQCINSEVREHVIGRYDKGLALCACGYCVLAQQ